MHKDSELRKVNLLFLIVVALQASNLLFLWLPQYVRLVLNEALFVFLPAYLYLRLTRQPVLSRVRWRWPGYRTAFLSLIVGLGLYPLSAASAGILLKLLGYTNISAPLGAIPSSLSTALLAILAYAVMAPICEEFLFRGVIQPVYERRIPKRAIWFVGLLFIVFHLSLLQGLSIVLISLALGYVNYRTRSLPASIITHFGANLLAALVITQDVLRLNLTPYLFTVPSILGGFLAALLALLVLAHQPRPAEISAQPTLADQLPPQLKPSRLAAVWPLLLAGIIYLTLTGLEIFHARKGIQVEALTLEAYTWQPGSTRRYEISNVIGEVVGEAQCSLAPLGAAVEMVCISQVAAYQVTVDQSTWMSSGGERSDILRWESTRGRPLEGRMTQILQDDEFQLTTAWTWNLEGMDLGLAVTGQQDSATFIPLAQTPLADDPALLLVADIIWPWQLAGLRFEMGEMGAVVCFNPYTWRPQTRDSGPLWEKQLVQVGDFEQVTTPAGVFSARKVTLGDRQTAWYDLQVDPFPVKFFTGVETWSLIDLDRVQD